MSVTNIQEQVAQFLQSLPSGVVLVAAAKTRSPEEVQAAIDGGVRILGYNYVQEAEGMQQVIGNQVQAPFNTAVCQLSSICLVSASF